MESFSSLFMRYRTRVYDYFCRMTRDMEASEDLTQTLFYKVIRYRATFRESGRFESWIFRMARNLLRDHMRTISHRRVVEQVILQETTHQDESSGGDEQDQLLFLALDTLPVDLRELIVLHHFEKLSYKAIASMNGSTEGAIKTRTYRAMKELREVYFSIQPEGERYEMQRKINP